MVSKSERTWFLLFGDNPSLNVIMNEVGSSVCRGLGVIFGFVSVFMVSVFF